MHSTLDDNPPMATDMATQMATQTATFAGLKGVSSIAADAAKRMGLKHPTPVQSQAIPAIAAGSDVLAQAPTGSGKTVAFALPVLQSLMQTGRHVQSAPATGAIGVDLERKRAASPHGERQPSERRAVRALVLVPTRELAAQVGDVINQLAQHWVQSPSMGSTAPLKIASVFGGVSINPQMLRLRGGADVVVATPGRLLDLVSSNALYLGQVQSLVLDEADRLLDLGFADELAQVLKLLPAKRQNLLFSATLPERVQALAAQLLREPTHIVVAPVAESAPDITQRTIAVDPSKRTQLLRHLIQTHSYKRVLVFAATKYTAHTVAEKLRKADIAAAPFHADLAQGTRSQVLADLKNGTWDVVVTTDLAARGLDVLNLNVVFNYDLPRSADDYTHRIGRTGRAGASGLAISFVSVGTQAHMRLIEKRQGLALEREVVDGFEPTEAPARDVSAEMPTHHQPSHATQGLDPNGGVKGQRPSKKDKLRAALK